MLVDVAQGHMLANYAIINNQMDGNLNLSETYFYLDSNFLFAFLKLTDNEFLNTAAFQLLEMISKDSGNIRVFEHIYEEARMIILNSKTWIEDRYSYNPIKASGVTKFLVENEKDVADVDVCIASLRSMLKHYGIEKIPADYQKTGKAVIDEDLLYDTISQEYKKNGGASDEDYKRETILKDVKSISEIYAYRNGMKPKTLDENRHIIVTLNSRLAYISKIFDEIVTGEKDNIPVCIPAGFLCTYLWMHEPEKLFEMNYKKIISKCCEWLKPTTELTEKFLNAITTQKDNELITQDMYIFLKTSPLVEKLLSVKTLGDVHRFNIRAQDEIIKEIEARGYSEGHMEYECEVVSHTQTKEKLDKLKARLEEYEDEKKSRTEWIEGKATTRTKRQMIIMLVACAVVLGVFVYSFFTELKWLSITMGIIFGILSIGSLVSGINILGSKTKLAELNIRHYEKKLGR